MDILQLSVRIKLLERKAIENKWPSLKKEVRTA